MSKSIRQNCVIYIYIYIYIYIIYNIIFKDSSDYIYVFCICVLCICILDTNDKRVELYNQRVMNYTVNLLWIFISLIPYPVNLLFR